MVARLIVHRLQEQRLGKLDRSLAEQVDRLGRGQEPRRRLKAGTVLVREHDGIMHEVMVVPDGFLWNGGTFASLSTIAKRITGTSWNGPRFFGLRTELRNRIERITLHRNRLAVELKPSEGDPTPASVSIPFVWQPQGRHKGIAHEPSQRPRLDPNASRAILMAIGRSRRWMAELIDRSLSIEDIAAREEMGHRNVRRLLPLACLSPNIVRAIADGTAPANLTITNLTAALPHDWAAQEQQFLTV